MVTLELKGLFRIWYIISAVMGTLACVGGFLWSIGLGEGVLAMAFITFLFAPLPLSFFQKVEHNPYE